MTALRTAAQQALEAKQVPLRELLASVPADARLVIDDADGKGTRFIPVGRLCREAAAALAEPTVPSDCTDSHQPVQEPVAWIESPHGAIRANPTYKLTFPSQLLHWQIPLYTAPPQRKPLTDEEISNILDDVLEGGSLEDLARAIERAHGIGEKP